MSAGDKCRECGTAIPADSPGGFCAQCLLGLGLSQMQIAECGAQKDEGERQKSEGRCRKSEEPKSPQVTAALTEKPGDRIGRYRLLEEIGHGGCGVVYMAEMERQSPR